MEPFFSHILSIDRNQGFHLVFNLNAQGIFTKVFHINTRNYLMPEKIPLRPFQFIYFSNVFFGILILWIQLKGFFIIDDRLLIRFIHKIRFPKAIK